MFVETLGGQTVPLTVKNDLTVGYLKRLIFEREGYRVVHQRLLFNGRMLEDSNTIAQCGLGPDSEVRMLYNASGIAPDLPDSMNVLGWATKWKLARASTWGAGKNKAKEEFTIFVKIPETKQFAVEAKPKETIAVVKERIEEQQGFPAGMLELMKAGKQLANDMTLNDHGIQVHPPDDQLVRKLAHWASRRPTPGGGPLDRESVIHMHVRTQPREADTETAG